MKKIAAVLAALVVLMSSLCALAIGGSAGGEDPVAIMVNGHDISLAELKKAATLHMFEASLQCAGNGYEYDILDPLNIEDAMDKVVFDLERWYVTQDLAEEKGLYPLAGDAFDTAVKDAEILWEEYRTIAWSDNGLAFLPAGSYQYVEDDPEGNINRYFASFGLTKEALLQEAMWEQSHEELGKTVTSSMKDKTPDEILDYYSNWFIEQMDAQYIVEEDDVIARAKEELGRDPSENQDRDGYEAYERSILINGLYYTLGESTIRDFERNGWTWKQEADGRFALPVEGEDDSLIYVRTNNNQPDGKLVMVDMTCACNVAYEYLGFGFDLAFNPERETFFEDYLPEVYVADYDDDDVLWARTEVSGGTMLIEYAELTLRLTLE